MPLMTETELEAKLGVDIRTIQRWRLTGEGPPYVKVGRGVRYRPEAVERWLDENTRQPKGAV